MAVLSTPGLKYKYTTEINYFKPSLNNVKNMSSELISHLVN